MAIALMKLPYPQDALTPHISAKTLEFHYGKHHAGYVEKLNGLIKGTEMEQESLEGIITQTAKDVSKSTIFNNVAQVWNHSFYWQCMKPDGGGSPAGAIGDKINADFGGYDRFVEQFKSAALSQFGSGWGWLVLKEKKLEIMKTSNADTPIAHGLKPLLTVDVWEHAYYLDYQNKRADYLNIFIKNLVNWDFVDSRLA
ncbi:MAG: superoxide dismutase [Candidatus Omnitrophica bacterium]|nr:superoxide dismutase [Candidatus Omnitrophota bacterium]